MREEEKKQSSRKTGISRFFNKRWVYPAVYIAAIAILLTTFLWLQNRGENKQDEYGYNLNPERQINDNDAIEVNRPLENFKWPVVDAKNYQVQTPFYDAASSAEEQEAAILDFGNSYQPNTGIDIVARNGETFDVVASMSGKVVRVEEDSFLGNVIVIEHADGVETRYQSVEDIKVQTGDNVKQGDVLAKAGRSLLNENAGIHVHFEIRKNDEPVNPLSYFEKSLATLQKSDASESDSDAADADEKANEREDEKADEREDADEKADEREDADEEKDEREDEEQDDANNQDS